MKTFGKKVQMIGDPLEKRENKMMSRIKNLWKKRCVFQPPTTNLWKKDVAFA